MKKFLLLSVCVIAALPAMAQRNVECVLSPFQELITKARNEEQINNLIARGAEFDKPVRCGGSVMQLAIRRGNPKILEALLKQSPKRASDMVSLDAFPIAGAPKQIPLILFAACYAPNAAMMELLMQANADVLVTDDFGRNILWYLSKNPVLRDTELQDKLNQMLLYGVTSVQPATQDNQAQPQGQPSTQGQIPNENTNMGVGLPQATQGALMEE